MWSRECFLYTLSRKYVLTLICVMNLTLTGAFLSIGFMTNFLSLKEMFRISLQGKPIFGVNLEKKRNVQKWLKIYTFNISCVQLIQWYTVQDVTQLGCRMFCNIQSADGATYKHTTFQKILKLNTPFKFTFESLLSFISVKNSDRKGKEVDKTEITSCLEIQEWWVYSRTHK